jgi:putative hydrolase of the HAD superfamily
LKTKHLFFDLDRTLWDFDKNSKQALIMLFDAHNLSHVIKDFDDFHAVYKNYNSQLWKAYGNGAINKAFLRTERFRITMAHFSISDPEIIKGFSDGYIDLSPKQTHLFPGTIETLRELKQASYNMHIITNGFKEVQYTKLDNCGLTSFFDVIICSEEVGQNKPSCGIFKHAMKLAGAQPVESVMIGDDLEVDIIGALNAGMYGIHFDPESKKYTSSTESVQNLTELPKILPFIFK